MYGALSYYITCMFCNTANSALSETIAPIWFNVNIDYLPACEILFGVQLWKRRVGEGFQVE